MKLFDLDSPIMRVLTKMTNVLWLGILATICCIPIITAGASLTALNYMSLKLVRNEDTYITRGFFKSFKENFKQATIIWLILLVVIAILVGDFFIMYNYGDAFPSVIKIIITVVAVIVVFTATFVFPVLAKFDNPVGRTIKNALVISILQFPKTILMVIFYLIPAFIILWPVVQIFPIALLFGLGAPAYGSALLYNKFFKKLETQIEEKNAENMPKQEEAAEEDDERIFHDEVDESISINEKIR